MATVNTAHHTLILTAVASIAFQTNASTSNTPKLTENALTSVLKTQLKIVKPSNATVTHAKKTAPTTNAILATFTHILHRTSKNVLKTIALLHSLLKKTESVTSALTTSTPM